MEKGLARGKTISRKGENIMKKYMKPRVVGSSNVHPC